MTKGALLCLGILVLMAIAGTCDYQDAVHFSSPTSVELVVREVPDTIESAYDVLRRISDKEKPQ